MSDPELPEEQESVRRLLADARHDAPTPPEVVARLDSVLAELQAERDTAPVVDAAPVLDLGARRRRRTVTMVLAAAAVVVAGVGIGHQLSGSGDDMASAGVGAERDSVGEQAPQSDADGELARTPEVQDPVALSAATLRGDLLAARDQWPSRQAQSLSTRHPDSGDTQAELPCPVPLPADSLALAVTVDGEPGVAVFSDPEADGSSQQVRRVDVRVCAAAEEVRTLRLPVD